MSPTLVNVEPTSLRELGVGEKRLPASEVRCDLLEKQLLAAVQSRAARVAVAASTVRGCDKGNVSASRRFLRHLDLAQFGLVSAKSFNHALVRSTKALRAVLPVKSRRWGIARKVLNIFLRDCLYTKYLDAAFHLHSHEALFELPLDSITVSHLKRATGRGALPRWPGAKHLTEEVSARFQAAATAEAKDRSER